jgi:hypothetical protein
MNVYDSKSQEFLAVWRNMHYEEINDLCLSPKVISLMKSRRIRFADHATLVEIWINTDFQSENLKEIVFLEDLDTDGV